MDKLYFIAQPRADGSPGRPISSTEDGFIVYEQMDEALERLSVCSRTIPNLKVFGMNVVLTGEVII